MDDEPTLAAALRELRESAGTRMAPEQLAAIERMVEELTGEGYGERAPRVGQTAPDFALPNVRGEEIRLGDNLGRRAVVLAFYRGAW